MTTYDDDDDKSVFSSHSAYPKLSGLCLEELDITSSGKVSFPELGMDMVNEGGAASDCDACPCLVTVPDISWQDNWLFRKQSLSIRNTIKQTEQPVSMLVPNPVEAAKAQIGNKDFDLVS